MNRPIIIPLDRGWTLSQERRAEGAPEIESIPAVVPGCTHTDLLANELIPDPFADTNEEDVAWVAACDWRYSCEFEVTAAHVAHERLELKFEGLDTLATIMVNGVTVGETANMHRRYRFDIGATSVVGSNSLDIVFRSATEYCDALRSAEGDWPSSSFGRPFNYLRKMACSWGWDWGPWLTSAGIWRPATLVAWSYGRLSDIRPHIDVDAGDHGRVAVDIDTVATAADAGVRLQVRLRDPDGELVTETIAPVHVGTTRVELDAGPIRRWWPHTHGEQPLYGLEIDLLRPDGVVHDRTTRRIGFRTIEIDTSTDHQGSAFTFVVNGRPIFARGVNWIPDDIFPSRVTAADYRERLQQAADANVDMIRVWGGGIYEDDMFYDTCDQLGLLVWQDFLFACAAYPEHLLAEEVEAEAHGNVSRLMHHTSLAIWNGNNENIWGYWDWGWQDVLQGRSWGAGFYHELLPQVCAELDPGRPYWPGSPYSGSDDVAPNADAQGCVHVWDVWNQIDLIRYRDHTPRFVSEFGWQAPPSMATLEEALSSGHRHRGSAAWLTHQKATDGDLKLDRGIRPRFGEVDDFETFCFAAHVVQARAITTGVEHFRSLRPWCMGTIWWQLNDCWPVTSWSVVDGAGRQKPSYSALREAYRSRLLTIQPRGDRLVVFALNETDDPWHVDTVARRLTLTGATLASEPVRLVIEPHSSGSSVLSPDVADATEPTDEVLVTGDGDAETWWWYAPDRDLRLRRPVLDVTHTVDGDDLVLTVTADVVVRELTIYPERVAPAARVDRQLVDLLPCQPRSIRVSGVPESDVAKLLARPACWSVVDIVDGVVDGVVDG